MATEDLAWMPFFPGRGAGAPLGPMVSRLSSGQLLDLTAEQLQRRMRRKRRRALMLAKAVCGMWLKDFLRHSAWVADHRDSPAALFLLKGYVQTYWHALTIVPSLSCPHSYALTVMLYRVP